jgi:hypothetical protein
VNVQDFQFGATLGEGSYSTVSSCKIRNQYFRRVDYL